MEYEKSFMKKEKMSDDSHVLKTLADVKENADNEIAIRKLIQLMDELRVKNQYNIKYRDLIFNEVEQRMVKY